MEMILMTNSSVHRDLDHPASPLGLLDRLPHRPPFLFLTRIELFEPGVRGHAQWQVVGDEDYFRGHFPGQPIVPGVLIMEALAQLAGLVGFHSLEDCSHGAARIGGRLAHVEVRFDEAVRPPAVIDLHASAQRSIGSLRKFEVQAMVSGKTVTRGSLVVAKVIEP